MTQAELTESMALYLKKLETESVIYKTIFEKAKLEREAIEELNIQKLNSILLEKQEMLDKINAIEEETANMRNLWKEAKDIIEPALSKEIEVFLNEFSAFIKELIEYEAETEKIFIKKNEEKEREIGAVRQARRTNKAYFSTPDIPPRKTDIIG